MWKIDSNIHHHHRLRLRRGFRRRSVVAVVFVVVHVVEIGSRVVRVTSLHRTTAAKAKVKQQKQAVPHSSSRAAAAATTFCVFPSSHEREVVTVTDNSQIVSPY